MCGLLQSLCNHGIEDIRKTMASSIYLIGLIIGRKLATQDLVPIYLRFFEDQDKVKVVALQNLCSFLSVIDRPQYDIIAAALSNCLGEYYEAGWRFREELSQQVLNLVRIFDEQSWSIHKINLSGIAIKLLRDRVNSIRKIALETVSITNLTTKKKSKKFLMLTFSTSFVYFLQIIEICKKLSEEENAEICSFLSNQFGSNTNWRHRQIFSEICCKWVSFSFKIHRRPLSNQTFQFSFFAGVFGYTTRSRCVHKSFI